MLSLSDINQLSSYFLKKVGGVMSGDILPDVTETLDLGSSSKKWDNLYVKTLNADSLSGSYNADTVDNFHASSTPTAGYLLALDGTAKFPASAIPTVSNADTVDNFHASATPTANYLLALDANALIPVAALPAITVANADTVDNIHASATATANYLFALDANAKFPLSILANGTAQYQIPVTGGTPYSPSWTLLSTYAGAGLSWSSNAYAVGAGTLITVGADTVGVSNGTAQYQIPVTGANPYTPSYTLLSSFAGAGMSWGSGVFDIGAGTLITVGADTVGVSNGSAQYQIPVTGSTPYTPAWTLLSTYAGAGLTWSNNMYEVGAGNGITVNANDVALTTPGTLTVSTTNNAASNHTHAITTSSNPGASASILASTAAGYLQLVRLGAGVSPSYLLHAQGTAEQLRLAYDATNYASFTVGSGGNLTLAPSGDFILDPVGNDVLPNTNYDINLGALTKKYLTIHAAELWVETLVAQDTIATIGGRILVGPTTQLTSDLANTAPNQGTATYRAVATANTGATVSTTVVCNKPTGTVAGDVMIAALGIGFLGTDTITPPTGWTQVVTTTATDTNSVSRVYYKVARANEPATYTWTASVAKQMAVTVLTFYGIDVRNPIDIYSGQANGSNATVTAAGITTTTANTYLIFVGLAHSASAARSFAQVATMTERSDHNATGETYYLSQATDTATYVGPGATGDRTSSITLAAQNIGQLVALRRAPASATISVKHNQADVQDILYMEANGSIEFFCVLSGPTGGSTPYTYEVERNLDGTGMNSWSAGDALFNTGIEGNGFIDLYSIRGVKSATQYGPSIVGNVRTSLTFNDWAEHWAIGNLNGIYGYSTTTYGTAFGKYVNGSAFITVDATNGFRIMRRSTGTDYAIGKWDINGNIFIGSNVAAAGTTNLLVLSTDYTHNSEGLGSGDLLIGDNSTGKANVLWDYSTGILNFRSGTTAQLWVDTNGALIAGSGGTAYVRVDDDGFSLFSDTGYDRTYSRVKWYAALTDANPFAWITANYQSSVPMLQIRGDKISTNNGVVQLRADGVSGIYNIYSTLEIKPGGVEYRYYNGLTWSATKDISEGYNFVPVTHADLYDTSNNQWNASYTASTGTYVFDADGNGNSWPTTAKAVLVLVQGYWAGGTSSYACVLRKRGTTAADGVLRSQATSVTNTTQVIVQCDSNGDIECNVSGGSMSTALVRLLGYFI